MESFRRLFPTRTADSPDRSSSGTYQQFLAFRLNASTFFIIEDDSFGEQPCIYVKIYPRLVVITDTGCNSPRLTACAPTTLRTFLETQSIEVNGNSPLNPGGSKPYLIICTHAHYDHILGIPSLLTAEKGGTPTTIVASSYCPSFITDDLPETSLCRYVGVETPKYAVSYWASDLDILPTPVTGPPLRIQTIHVPGHTPDSLAWYDIDEAHLYVGDTFYARQRTFDVPQLPEPGYVPGQAASQAAIIFPRQGNWIEYMQSLSKLLDFVGYRNAQLEQQWRDEIEEAQTRLVVSPHLRRVKIAAGHVTVNDDAETMITQVQAFFEDIIAGRVPVKGSNVKRGTIFDYWPHVSPEGRFDVLAPRRLLEDIRQYRRADTAFRT